MLLASYTLLAHGGGLARTRAGISYVVLNLVGSALFLIALGCSTARWARSTSPIWRID
jgi:multicomponent K+:H+ antiporter subunit D